MPKFDLKQVQKQLEKVEIYPLYWVYGPERLKSAELIKRIKTAVLGDVELSAFSLERLDGTELDAAEIADRARTLMFGSGPRLVLVSNAHAVKDLEELEDLLGDGKPKKREELETVCVFVSKDLDKRKKFSKKLIEAAACVEAAEVESAERETWIKFLAKRKNLELPGEVIQALAAGEPWSLEGMERELEKFEIGGISPDLLLAMVADAKASDRFIRVFFRRELKPTLESVPDFASEPDAALPLLGYLGWSSRQLQAFKCGGGWIADHLRDAATRWSLEELARLDRELSMLDYKSKQTASEPLGLWGSLSVKFCKN
jgi:DNA polymerase III delta subunit